MITRKQIIDEFIAKINSNGYTAVNNPKVIFETELDAPIIVVSPVSDSYNPELIGGKGRIFSLNVEIYDEDYDSAESIWNNIKDDFEGQKRLSDDNAYFEEQDTSFEFESDIQMCIMTINFNVNYNNDV